LGYRRAVRKRRPHFAVKGGKMYIADKGVAKKIKILNYGVSRSDKGS